MCILGTALPPCELSQRPGKTDLLRCPIGTRNAYPTIGPDGALRPCNHWPTVLGSLLEQPTHSYHAAHAAGVSIAQPAEGFTGSVASDFVGMGCCPPAAFGPM